MKSKEETARYGRALVLRRNGMRDVATTCSGMWEQVSPSPSRLNATPPAAHYASPARVLFAVDTVYSTNKAKVVYDDGDTCAPLIILSALSHGPAYSHAPPTLELHDVQGPEMRCGYLRCLLVTSEINKRCPVARPHRRDPLAMCIRSVSR